jgi:hypothetical protein
VLSGIALYSLAGVEHSKERGFGMPLDIVSYVEPLVFAKLSPKLIRIVLHERHGVAEDRLPTRKQLSNYKNYWLRNFARSV